MTHSDPTLIHTRVINARRRALRWWPLFAGLHGLALFALVAWLAHSTPLFDAATVSAALSGQLPADEAQLLAVMAPFFCIAWLATLAATWLISAANFLRDRKLLRAISG